MTETATVYAQYPGYYNYNVMNMGYFVVEKPVIYESYYYQQNEILYCATATEKGVYCYTYCANSPIMYKDPNGESIVLFGIMASALIGGFQMWNKGISKGVTGIERFGYFIGGVAIGAGAGAAGAAAGAAVSGTIGFGAGFTSGFAGGFAVGFVSGAGNSWVGGNSFSQGLLDGLKGGMIGGLTGGIMKGISGGIYAQQHDGNFWSGEGATFDVLAGITDGNTVTVGEGIEYSNKYAKQFSDDYFGKNVKGLNNLYADGSIPKGYSTKGDLVFNSKGEGVGGTARYLGNGKTDVYLYKWAFTSKERLYLTMGHEYLHAGYNTLSEFVNKIDIQHTYIKYWESTQASVWKFDIKSYPFQYRPLINSALDPSNFGIRIRYLKPW